MKRMPQTMDEWYKSRYDELRRAYEEREEILDKIKELKDKSTELDNRIEMLQLALD